MPLTIDYCMVPQSPCAYMGHARFTAIAEAAQAQVRLRVIDLDGKVFPVSGGLPLAKRAPQRQAYRLVELRRFSDWLGLPMNLQPACARLIGRRRRHP
jgi:2-hydroxychromene-2-carboxylate isomerase